MAAEELKENTALGRMRTDLLIIWTHKGGIQKVVIELKVLHRSLNDTSKEGVKQTAEYMDLCNTDQGHLVIFDKSKGKN